jgi:prevent-host-death family protein
MGSTGRALAADLVCIEVCTMTKAIGVRDARSRFAELLDRAQRGETISVTRRGEEIARLVPGGGVTERLPGRMKGRIWMAPDLDATPPEVQDAVERDLEPR